jgi:hypothetical protein
LWKNLLKPNKKKTLGAMRQAFSFIFTYASSAKYLMVRTIWLV